VENFPDFPPGIMGPELMDNFRAQSIRFGTDVITETVFKVDLSLRPFRYWREYVEDQELETADTLIIATGASAKRLGLKGENTYWQSGISACAVCDGAVPTFRNKPLAVIGGGDSAAEEATCTFPTAPFPTYTEHFCDQTSQSTARTSTSSSAGMSSALLRSWQNTCSRTRKWCVPLPFLFFPPLMPLADRTLEHRRDGVPGDGGLLKSLRLKNLKTGEESDLPVAGLFFPIGHEPATTLVQGQVQMDEDGYIVTAPGTAQTSMRGVFAAGDVQDKRYRQAITSAGSGCMVALEAERLLAEEEDCGEENRTAKDVPAISEEAKTNPELQDVEMKS
jgi:thioredoxin reductase (NADPH)